MCSLISRNTASFLTSRSSRASIENQGSRKKTGLCLCGLGRDLLLDPRFGLGGLDAAAERDLGSEERMRLQVELTVARRGRAALRGTLLLTAKTVADDLGELRRPSGDDLLTGAPVLARPGLPSRRALNAACASRRRARRRP